jgi:hypothetical protein
LTIFVSFNTARIIEKGRNVCMKKWNPFGKLDMEIGSFLKASKFNKVYGENNESIKETEIDHSNKDAAISRKGK